MHVNDLFQSKNLASISTIRLHRFELTSYGFWIGRILEGETIMLEDTILAMVMSLLFSVYYFCYLMGLLETICYHFHWKSQ